MRIRGTMVAVIAAAAMLFSAFAGGARSGERVALVIGNSAYDGDALLINPEHDAADMAQVLGELGFHVIRGTNLDLESFEAKLAEFTAATRGAEAALLFYAGHGLQLEDRNYLVPIGTRIEQKWHLERRTIRLDNILSEMRGETNLVFLDACRDNPLADDLVRSMGLNRSYLARHRGLARVDTPTQNGSLIAYATQPGNVALDGRGRNSPFTTALLEHIRTPGLSATDLLTKVAGVVKELTSGKQEPWYSSMGLDEIFYFVEATPETEPKTEPADRPEAAKEAFEEARRIDTIPAYQAIIEHYPDEVYAKFARNEIDRIRKQADMSDESTIATESVSSNSVASPGLSDPPTSAPPGVPPDSPGSPPGVGDVIRDCPDVCPELVVLKAGSYRMGGTRRDEKPRHEVRMEKRLAIGRHEVTRREYAAFVEDTGWTTKGSCDSHPKAPATGRSWRSPGYDQDENHPVVCVSWEDATEYVRWLSRKTRKDYRLPSESEWEFAARAGTEDSRHWGEDPSAACAYANVTDRTAKELDRHWKTHECSDGHVYTSPVGSFSPNGFGLYDMMGNTWEWTEDCWHDSYRGAPWDGSAWNRSGNCDQRVARGGGWYASPPSQVRSAERFKLDSSRRTTYIGFRIARTLD